MSGRKISAYLCAMFSLAFVMGLAPMFAFAAPNTVEDFSGGLIGGSLAASSEDGDDAGWAPDVVGELSVDETVEVLSDSNGVYYSFTPAESGWYRFFSSDAGDSDPYAELFSADEEELVSNDDGLEGMNFMIVSELEGGATYYIKASAYGSDARYSLTVEKIEAPVSINVSLPEDKALIYGDESFGYWDTYGEDETEYFRFSEYAILDMLEVTAIYEDGSEEQPSVSQLSLDGFDCTEWVAPGSYEVTVSYLGATSAVTIPVVINPVDSIEFVLAGGESYRLVEYYDAYDGGWDTDVDYYYIPSFELGDVLKVRYSDDRGLVEYTYQKPVDDEAEWCFIAEDGSFISPDDIDKDTNQVEDGPWVLGRDDMIVTFSYKGATCSVPVTIIENPVTGITFEPAYEYVANEDIDGYLQEVWDENDNPTGETWFEYALPSLYGDANDYPFHQGDKLTVYEGDTSTVYTFDDSVRAFVDDEGNALQAQSERRYLETRSNQSFDTPWGVGAHTFSIEYMGCTCDVDFEVIGNPVKEITYSYAGKTELVKDADGYEAEDWYYNEDTGEDEAVTWFRYDVERALGDVLTVVTNEETKNYELQEVRVEDGWDWAYVNTDDSGDTISYYDVRFEDNQSFDNQWRAGHTYYVTVSYLGRETKLTFDVVDNPVESIDFIPAAPYKLIEDADGYINEDEDGQEYFEYTIPFQPGDKLIAKISDGEIVYTYGKCDDEDGYHWAFVDTNGVELNGNDYSYSSDQWENHWDVGEHVFTLRYMGRICEIPVTVVENSVESIKFEPASPYILVENNRGEWQTDFEEQEFFYYYGVSFQEGDTLTVTYTSGETAEYTCALILDDVEGYYYWAFTSEDGTVIRSDTGDGVELYGGQYENHWIAGGENYAKVTYMGRSVSVPVTIIPAEDAVYAEVTTVDDARVYSSLNIDGTTVKFEEIENPDGTTTLRTMRLTSADFVFSVYPTSVLNEVDRASYVTADGVEHGLEPIESLNMGRAFAYRVPAMEGEITVKAYGKQREGVEINEEEGVIDFNGITDVDGKALPNASKLSLNLPSGVTLVGVVYGGGSARDTVILPNDKSTSSLGLDYYLWPDSTSSLIFAVPANAAIATPQLTAGTGEIVSWHRPAGSTTLIVDARLSKPGTLTIGLKANQTIAASDVKKTFGDAAFALGAKLTAGNGKLSFSSDNAKVATVDANGKVTIKGAGSAKITVKAAETDGYKTASKTVTITVAKAANPLKLAKATRNVKLKKVKKAKQTVAGAKVAVAGQGTVTYTKAKVNKAKFKKNFTVNKKNGKITVKKGTPKGTYKVTVKAEAAGNANYNKSAAKTAVVTIKVK